MTTSTSQHLTEDQFAELLSGGTPAPAVAAHLGMCDLCREELNMFLTSVDSLGKAAIEWSRSQPVAHPRTTLWKRDRFIFSPQLGWAIAGALLLAIGVPAMLHDRRPTASSRGEAAIAASEDSPAQIAQDNRLMESVDSALQSTDPSPFREYGLQTGPQRIRPLVRSGAYR
jgi:hypothetical protein